MRKRTKKRPKRSPAVAIRIDEELWKAKADARSLLRRAALRALAGAAAEGAATILLTGDGKIAELNVRFRGQDRPTNVLAFPSSAPGYLGDIAIAYGVVANEARAQGKTFEAHAAHLAVHGMLHLLGYDHLEERDAALMEAHEARILAALGIADPYQRKAA